MESYLSLVLHAHLPFVRHPEHELFLEESWLFEAITETYLPLLQLLEQWEQEALDVTVTVTLTPTLCAMFQDPLLQDRYEQRLNRLIELAEKEIHRTRWQPSFHELAGFYRERLVQMRRSYLERKRDLIGSFRQLQDRGRIEVMTSAATHAVLPLLAHHRPSLRAQILLGRDQYRRCFGREPRGIWLPECAWCEAIDPVLKEAGFHWFVLDTHGVLHATPRPRYAVFAPILTPNGIAAFGRDRDSAREVWSRAEGYPGDARYRDFYRDAGFDLDLEYVRAYLPGPIGRGFTGIKYHRISEHPTSKEVYQRGEALAAASMHAEQFLEKRLRQFSSLGMDRPPLLVCPYDAELFGHWWYEGPEFLDRLVRKAGAHPETFHWITPGAYLAQHNTLQVCQPAASSWGEQGHLAVWLDESNHWIYPHLNVAQERMSELAAGAPTGTGLHRRALKQAARELLLAQASDWPFILRAGTSADYAQARLNEHLLRFNELYQQIRSGQILEDRLQAIERQDNLFPELEYRYWAEG